MFDEISRGYLPGNYYSDRLVFKRRAPLLEASRYPNKIEVSSTRSYAIVVHKTGARLSDAFAWMATHPYIMVLHTAPAGGIVAVEAYESPQQRAYAMVVLRAATPEDEHTARMMQPHGESRRSGACPAPVTGLLLRSAVNMQAVWLWLARSRGRLARLVDAPLPQPFAPTTVAAAAGVHVRRGPSRESLDSVLPRYEPPPPSLHCSVEYAVDEGVGLLSPPDYGDVAADTPYGRSFAQAGASSSEPRGFARTFTRSMPALSEPPPQDDAAEAESEAEEESEREDEAAAPAVRIAEQTATVQPHANSSAPMLRSLQVHMRRSRLAARTAPEYSARRRPGGWLARLLSTVLD
ncbi:hypothetical protein LPJ53_005892 [Coemansia erecta]|uniref:Uncharacterized protein n=1 Tax=Coemansia erecta TaxID=147472 RepID=A0A9W7XUM4_9FUNG|nr:hypothetical protein LPJ53_005892 [Coemansia erecta]